MKGAGHVQQAEVVGLHFRFGRRVVAAAHQFGHAVDTGIVDQQIDVTRCLSRGPDLRGVGDIKRQMHDLGTAD